MNRISLCIFAVLVMTGIAWSQSITVIQPNGNEKLVKGSLYEIKWNASGTTNPFKITLWRNGALVGIIKSESDAGTGVRTFEWTVGNLEGGGIANIGSGYKVKVKERETPVADESDEGFDIVLFIAPLTVKAYIILPPDLKISIIPVTGQSGEFNKETLVEFKVDNIGKGASKETTLRVFMGQKNTDTWVIKPIEPGRFRYKTKKFTPKGVGYIAWAADVDQANNIGDSNRTNNYASYKMIVKGPDLKITNVNTPDYKKTVGAKCTVNVTVTNIGHANAGRFELDADMDTCPGIAHGRDYKVFNGVLKPGESTTFQFTHRYACFKMVGVNLYVDKNNQVKEENESNNQCGAPFHIDIRNVGSKQTPWNSNCN